MELCNESPERVRTRNSFHVVDVTRDIDETPLHEATVLYLYLPVQALEKVRPMVDRALAAKPSIKVITNEYHFPDVENWEVLAEQDTIRVARLKKSE